jgi:hypothetical protein
VSRQPLAGNRLARPALAKLRGDRGLRQVDVAGELDFSAAFLGNLERRDCRAAPDHQGKLAAFYGVSINDLFEPLGEVGYQLLPRKGEWCLASEAERVLGVTGEGLRFLVEKGVILRRGGETRYQYRWPTLLELVPEGSLKLSEVRDLTGLTMDQLWYRRRRRSGRLRTFQPWPGAAYRVRREDVEALERELDDEQKRKQRRRPRTGRAPTATVIEAARKRIDAAVAELDQRKSTLGLQNNEEAARILNVDVSTIAYYRDVGLLDGVLLEANGHKEWGYTADALRRCVVDFARGLPPIDQRGPGQTKLGKRGVHLVEQNVVNQGIGRGLFEEGDPEAAAALQRMRGRRQKILATDARVTEAARSGGKNKGRKEAQRALALAQEAVAARPKLTQRGVCDYVVVKLFGPDAICLPDGRRRPAIDADYRRYRARVKRYLDRAFRDEGVPPELSHLFKRELP